MVFMRALHARHLVGDFAVVALAGAHKVMLTLHDELFNYRRLSASGRMFF